MTAYATVALVLLLVLIAAGVVGKAIAPHTATTKDDRFFEAVNARLLRLEEVMDPIGKEVDTDKR